MIKDLRKVVYLPSAPHLLISVTFLVFSLYFWQLLLHLLPLLCPVNIILNPQSLAHDSVMIFFPGQPFLWLWFPLLPSDSHLYISKPDLLPYCLLYFSHLDLLKAPQIEHSSLIFLPIFSVLVNVTTVHPGDQARILEVLLDASFGLDVHIRLISRDCWIPLLLICPIQFIWFSPVSFLA